MTASKPSNGAIARECGGWTATRSDGLVARACATRATAEAFLEMDEDEAREFVFPSRWRSN